MVGSLPAAGSYPRIRLPRNAGSRRSEPDSMDRNFHNMGLGFHSMGLNYPRKDPGALEPMWFSLQRCP
jgi:hypothetical protein